LFHYSLAEKMFSNMNDVVMTKKRVAYGLFLGHRITYVEYNCTDHVQPNERQLAVSNCRVWRHRTGCHLPLSEKQGQRQVPTRTNVFSFGRKSFPAKHQTKLHSRTVQPLGKPVRRLFFWAMKCPKFVYFILGLIIGWGESG